MAERNVQDRSTWTVEQQAGHEHELQQRREAWEQRKLQKEQEERGKKRARLKEYLDLRSSVHLDIASKSPTQTQLENWTEEFISSQVRRAEDERERRRAEAAEENYDF